MNLIPLLPFTVAFIVGILLLGSGVGVWLLILPTLAALLLCLLKRPYAALMCCSVVIGWGVSFARIPSAMPENLSDSNCQFSAVALEVKNYEPTRVIIAEIDSCSGQPCSEFLVKLTVPSSLPEIDERDRIVFRAAISPLTSNLDLPDETDYDAPLRRMGVVGSAFVRPDSIMSVIEEPGFLNDVRRLRNVVTLAIVETPIADGLKEFLNATLVGDRSMLTTDTLELFSATGLSHLLALSGLHVGIIAGFVSGILFPLWLLGWRRLRTIVLIATLWLFAAMTGLSASVVRAVVMAMVFAVTSMLQRSHSSFNSLCIAALVILLFAPEQLYTVSFQLSFLAVASILLFAEKLNPIPRRRQWLHTLVAYPIVTLAAMLGTGIASAFYFNIFPLLFLPANFVGVLLLPPMLIGGALLLMLNAVGFDGILLGKVLDGLYWLFETLVGCIGNNPEAVIDDIYISPSTLAAWFLAMIPLALWLYKRRLVYAMSFGVCLCFLVTTAMLTSSVDDSDGLVEVYIPRSHDHTSLIVRDGKQMTAFTTAPKWMTDELRDEYSRKYRRYALKRNVDSIGFATLSSTSPQMLSIAGRRFILLYGAVPETDTVVAKVDYAVICRGFRGDVTTLGATIESDSILLSADLNLRRHDRYFRELRESGAKVRSLKNSPFALTLTESR